MKKKENLQIKSNKRVLENQRKLKGMIEIKKTARVSPANIVATVTEDVIVKRLVEVEAPNQISAKPPSVLISSRLG